MVKFSAAEDDPSGEVENFLEAVEVFCEPFPYTVRQY